jgi:hypothetical protein
MQDNEYGISKKAQKRTEDKFRGLGGHMTAALIHKIKWYDRTIQFAKMNGGNWKAIEDARNRLVMKTRDQLEWRGYYGPVDPRRDYNYQSVQLRMAA